MKKSIDQEQVSAFLCEALQHEQGGIQVYETAVRCAQEDDLREEWQEYLKQTREHVDIYKDLCRELGVDPEDQPPGRKIVKQMGEAFVAAMERAEKSGDPAAAEIVAAECVVLAEVKCHMNWELVGEIAHSAKGEEAKALSAAHAKVEQEEDEHLYHTMGWARELWIRRLGMPAALPPPEEQKEVTTAIGAARAKMARKEMIRGRGKKSGS